MLRTQIPYRCGLLEMSTAQQGIILAAVSYVQAFLALSLWKSRRWMYHPFPIALAALCGITALLLFAFTESYPAYVCAGLLYGCYSGAFCFFFAYHSLANPEKSHRYVAVNEVIVAACRRVACGRGKKQCRSFLYRCGADRHGNDLSGFRHVALAQALTAAGGNDENQRQYGAGR